MTPPSIDLVTLGAEVEWTDATAAEAARAGSAATGRLRELGEWLAATQGRFPPTPPGRPRCVVFAGAGKHAEAVGTDVAVGIRGITLDAGTSVTDALAAGAAAADVEIDLGADLLVVADPDTSPASAVLVGLLTGAEPVALLPRGALAVDTTAWVERAEHLRDTRRRVARLRNRPDDLLAALDHPPLAATTGFVLRAAARRTPLVLDGTAVLAAALLAYDTQARAGRWWRVADTSPDPVHARAAEELVQQPVLDLQTCAGDGVAGLLTVPVLRAAAYRSTPVASRG